MKPLTSPISPYGDDANELPRPSDVPSQGAQRTTPNNEEENGAAFDWMLDKAVRTLREVEHWVEEWYGGELTEIRLQNRGDHCLAIIKARYGTSDKVAFVSGATMAEALVNFCVDLSYLNVKWKRDRYPKYPRD